MLNVVFGEATSDPVAQAGVALDAVPNPIIRINLSLMIANF